MRLNLIYLSWLISIVSTTGSLIFSNYLNLPPCSLCWWQRIFMFPLVYLFTIGFIKKDIKIFNYSFLLTLSGLIVAVYHNLLYFGFIPESITACSAGVSCTNKQIVWFGFITIPFLSLLAFSFLTVIGLFAIFKKGKYHEQETRD